MVYAWAEETFYAFSIFFGLDRRFLKQGPVTGGGGLQKLWQQWKESEHTATKTEFTLQRGANPGCFRGHQCCILGPRSEHRAASIAYPLGYHPVRQNRRRLLAAAAPQIQEFCVLSTAGSLLSTTQSSALLELQTRIFNIFLLSFLGMKTPTYHWMHCQNAWFLLKKKMLNCWLAFHTKITKDGVSNNFWMIL